VAIELMEKEAGGIFDPELFQKFRELLTQEA
jgi:HD-GYP domain-containing protein (c-di-GMP phosphodiesterase class II)